MQNFVIKQFANVNLTLTLSLAFIPLYLVHAERVQCFSSDGGDFQLMGGEINYFFDSSFRATGRVDVCFNRTFGSVCSQGWDDNDAMAFCQYQYGFGTVGRVINGSEFGISPIGIVLTDVKCSGNRNERITDCAYGEFGRSVGTTAECSGVGNVAGVICTRECDSGNARLVGGEAYFEGRVEACVNNRWRSICDIGWDDVDASVVCRSIGFFVGKFETIIFVAVICSRRLLYNHHSHMQVVRL